MGLFSTIFDKVKDTAVKDVGSIVDNITTTDDEKLKAKNDLARILTDSVDKALQAQTVTISTEMQGNFLQRSWRPISALSFTFIIFYRFFLAPVFHFQSIDMPDQFWTLMFYCLGGYTGFRSLEKITDSFTKNVDLSFLKKKDREQSIVDK